MLKQWSDIPRFPEVLKGAGAFWDGMINPKYQHVFVCYPWWIYIYRYIYIYTLYIYIYRDIYIDI